MSLQRIGSWLGGVWLAIAVGLLLVTVLTVLCQVAFRYLLQLPLAWTEEVSRLALVGSVYAGIVPAYLRGEHIVVDFFVRFLPRPVFLAYVGLLKAVTAAVAGYLAWGAYLQIPATANMTLIALPAVPIAVVYALQFAALVSFVAAVLLTWRLPETYVPDARETGAP